MYFTICTVSSCVSLRVWMCVCVGGWGVAVAVAGGGKRVLKIAHH